MEFLNLPRAVPIGTRSHLKPACQDLEPPAVRLHPSSHQSFPERREVSAHLKVDDARHRLAINHDVAGVKVSMAEDHVLSDHGTDAILDVLFHLWNMRKSLEAEVIEALQIVDPSCQPHAHGHCCLQDM